MKLKTAQPSSTGTKTVVFDSVYETSVATSDNPPIIVINECKNAQNICFQQQESSTPSTEVKPQLVAELTNVHELGLQNNKSDSLGDLDAVKTDCLDDFNDKCVAVIDGKIPETEEVLCSKTDCALVNDNSAIFGESAAVFSEETSNKSTEFLRCDLALTLLKFILNWWKLETEIPSSINSLLTWGNTLGFKGSSLEAFSTLIFTFCWLLWCHRNAKIFEEKELSIVLLVGKIQSDSFFWLNSRGKLRRKLLWLNWVSNPVVESRM